jgi:hypothetical protein
LAADDVGSLLVKLRSNLRRKKKIPIRAASPIIGMATISAILTFPRCPLKNPVPEILAAGVSEPRLVELLGGELSGEVGILLEEGPLVVDDEPEFPAAEELEPEPEPELVVPIGLVGCCEELLSVDPKRFADSCEELTGVEELVESWGEVVGDDTNGLGDVAGVEFGSETVGEFDGGDVVGVVLTEVVVVDPKRARISISVASHATGIPSFQTVRVGTLGFGFTVRKL